MKTIWKYELATLRQTIPMPVGARILSAAAQGTSICVWVEVDPSTNYENVTLVTVLTGHPMPDVPMTFIGTVLLNEGMMVVHVYREDKP